MGMNLLPGSRVLERYVVNRLIGEGGMGQVFLGVHETLRYPVAIKILTDFAAGLIERFEQEARLMARIRHPNVVSVLDFGLLGQKIPCIVMEFVEGESVQDRLRRLGALPWTEAVELTMGMLAGLHAIHAQNVLHRDIKPSNALIAKGNPEVVKLIDFGVSKQAGAELTHDTRMGFLVGTPAYMAPERFAGRPADARSDLYAVGLILYKMLSGAIPFQSEQIEALLRRTIVPAPPPVIPTDLPQPPQTVIDLLMRVLSIDPAARPQTALEFGKALRLASRGEAVVAPLPSQPKSSPSPLPAAVPGAAPAAGGGGAAVSPAQERRIFLVGARIPAMRLRTPEDRRWLAEKVSRVGRAFTFGDNCWLAILAFPHGSQRGKPDVDALVQAIAERYGNAARVAWSQAGPDFTLSAASLTGAAPLPDEIQLLFERLEA